LDSFLKELKVLKFNAYLKVPASSLCRDNNGKPLILGLESAEKIIVEMYGEQLGEYKNLKQMFLGSEMVAPSAEYPNGNCPKFPSYSQLLRFSPKVDFYIEKTLQQEEPGFLGNELEGILKSAAGVYNKIVFLDAYPLNILPL
jgi:hypothetical protein